MSYASPLPTIETGDTLWIDPDLGRPYTATVVDVLDDRIKARIPHDPKAPVPTGSQTRTFYKESLEEWHVRCDLVVNPDRPEHY